MIGKYKTAYFLSNCIVFFGMIMLILNVIYYFLYVS